MSLRGFDSLSVLIYVMSLSHRIREARGATGSSGSSLYIQLSPLEIVFGERSVFIDLRSETFPGGLLDGRR